MAKKKKRVSRTRAHPKKSSPARPEAQIKRKRGSARATALSADTPPQTVTRILENNREHQAIERALEAQRDKTLRAYRAQVVQLESHGGAPVKRIFAEGDSWFNYPLGRAVISQLQGLIKTPIANFAWPGAETRQLLALHERKEIEKRLKDGPEPGKRWDVLLFSGGGDDIVGDQMVLFLKPYDPSHPNQNLLTARFNEVLNLVMGAYQDLIALRDALSPNTLIVTHSYDYAWASGIPACWVGPWLKPSLDYVGVPDANARHKVVSEMVNRFETELQKVAALTHHFVLVPTHGALTTEDEWANELHPKDPGFGIIAGRFRDTLRLVLGDGI